MGTSSEISSLTSSVIVNNQPMSTTTTSSSTEIETSTTTNSSLYKILSSSIPKKVNKLIHDNINLSSAGSSNLPICISNEGVSVGASITTGFLHKLRSAPSNERNAIIVPNHKDSNKQFIMLSTFSGYGKHGVRLCELFTQIVYKYIRRKLNVISSDLLLYNGSFNEKIYYSHVLIKQMLFNCIHYSYNLINSTRWSTNSGVSSTICILSKYHLVVAACGLPTVLLVSKKSGTYSIELVTGKLIIDTNKNKNAQKAELIKNSNSNSRNNSSSNNSNNNNRNISSSDINSIDEDDLESIDLNDNSNNNKGGQNENIVNESLKQFSLSQLYGRFSLPHGNQFNNNLLSKLSSTSSSSSCSSSSSYDCSSSCSNDDEQSSNQNQKQNRNSGVLGACQSPNIQSFDINSKHCYVIVSTCRLWPGDNAMAPQYITNVFNDCNSNTSVIDISENLMKAAYGNSLPTHDVTVLCSRLR